MNTSLTQSEIDEIEAQDDLELEPLKFWEEKQRELVTSVVDYNLSTLSDLIPNSARRGQA